MKNYSITEVAKILGKSRQYIWLQIISKNLNAEKVGNYYSIKESDYKEFLTNSKNDISDSDNKRSETNNGK